MLNGLQPKFKGNAADSLKLKKTLYIVRKESPQPFLDSPCCHRSQILRYSTNRCSLPARLFFDFSFKVVKRTYAKGMCVERLVINFI